MEWREKSTVSCEEAFVEAQLWIEAVTKKTFGSSDFRSALEDGVLLCELINNIRPGVVRKVNRLPTPIAGLDNLNVFLKACGKLGLKEAQLFHPGDLQDLSSRVTVKNQETNRRLKNVLITIFWLGRRAQGERLYDGPHLKLKAFEGLLGSALYKALQESSGQKSTRDSGFGDTWCSEREEPDQLRGRGGGRGGRRRDDSLDSLESVRPRPHSISSDITLRGSSEGACFSDTEADSAHRMADNKDTLSYRRTASITPKVNTQFNQFLPTKDKPSGYVPAPLRKKRAERNDDSRRSWASAPYVEEEDGEGSLSSSRPAPPSAALDWTYEYESGSDSDADRPDPDLVLDDLASRRFHSPSPAPPTNFAVPASPLGGGRGGGGGTWPRVTVTPNASCLSSAIYGGGTQQPPRQAPTRRRQAVSTDSLFREIYGDSEDEDDEEGYADPVHDDLYARKVGAKAQAATKAAYDKFLPKFWTPEEDVHIQKIKMGSQTRPWYKKMQGFSYKKSGSSSDDSDGDISPWLSSGPAHAGPCPSHSHAAPPPAATVVVGKRQRQGSESLDGSKSTSDIHVDPSVARQMRFEELQKHQEQIKQTEDKWQDDLSKWKNRRRSVNSDIVKKKEEREKIEQITYGDSSRRSKTFKEMQEERDNRKNSSSVGSRLNSLYGKDEDGDEDVFDKPVPSIRTRAAPPSRSRTIDNPYASSDPPAPPRKEDEPPAAAPRDTVDALARGNTAVVAPISRRSPAPPERTEAPLAAAPPPRQPDPPVRQPEPPVRQPEPRAAVAPPPRQPQPRVPEVSREPPPSSSAPTQRPQSAAMEPRHPTAAAAAGISASLPRSYQRSDSARLTSVVTPRPFGAQTSRITSLPRTFASGDASKRVNGDVDAAKKSLVPSRYHQFMTSEDEAHSSSAHSSEGEEEEAEPQKPAVQNVSPVQTHVKSEVSPAPTKESSQQSCELRISLNQKPNSSRDFGFQAAWDSTGARVTTVQPGSPAQMFQLQPGDEVLTLNGRRVADMSYMEWKAGMEAALQDGSLVMDVRRHGNNNWNRDQPSLPFQSHKTINLTSTDHPILLGFPDSNAVSASLDFTSRTSTGASTQPAAVTRPVIDAASNGVNGGFREETVTLRKKESEPISLKNLKRRSEFFDQGGSEAAVPDIPVPSIAPSSSRWSWDPEEERRRQEKWQKEQERLLQEKYKRDQEKLQEEWLKAQQEVNSSQQQSRSLEVRSHGVSPLSPVSQPPPWEEEERRRREEQELQRQAEERRKREEEERELRRLQEERQRKQRQEEEERRRMQEEELSWQRRREEEREEERRREEQERRRREEEERRRREEQERRRREDEERRRQEAAEQQRREHERAASQQPPWAAGSRAVAVTAGPALSFADRAKSRSSPQLDEEETPPWKGVWVRSGFAQQLLEEQLRSKQDKQAQSERVASQLEMERRNILNAMRYREPETVMGDRRGQPVAAQAELERQQILNEMKKKTPLLTDSSWIRQRAPGAGAAQQADGPPMRRGESLDNLDSYNSWRSSWTPRSNSHFPSYARPNSALSGAAPYHGGGSGSGARPGAATLPSSISMGSLRGWAGTPTSPRSQQSQSPSSSLSPTTSPEPAAEPGGPQQRSRSVSGKKICTFCDSPLGKGAAMIIESLGLCYHLGCFKCIDCKSDLGGSEAGAEVRIRNKQLYCNSCYMRFKSGQPTAM